MNIGFGLCYFTDKLHLPERRLELLPGESASQENLEKLAAVGIHHTETSYAFDWQRPEPDLRKLAQGADAAGVAIYSFHDDSFLTQLDVPDADARQHAHDDCLAQARGMSFLDAKVMVIHISTPEDLETVTKAHLDMAAASVEKLGKACHNLGILIAVENSPRPNSLPYNLKVVERTDPAYVGICIDAGHVHCVGLDVTEAVLQAGNRLRHLHIADNHGPEEGDVHLIPYEGTIDWRSFYQALERVDYPGVLMYEIIHRPNIDQVLKQVTESYAHMSGRVA